MQLADQLGAARLTENAVGGNDAVAVQLVNRPERLQALQRHIGAARIRLGQLHSEVISRLTGRLAASYRSSRKMTTCPVT